MLSLVMFTGEIADTKVVHRAPQREEEEEADCGVDSIIRSFDPIREFRHFRGNRGNSTFNKINTKGTRVRVTEVGSRKLLNSGRNKG